MTLLRPNFPKITVRFGSTVEFVEVKWWFPVYISNDHSYWWVTHDVCPCKTSLCVCFFFGRTGSWLNFMECFNFQCLFTKKKNQWNVRPLGIGRCGLSPEWVGVTTRLQSLCTEKPSTTKRGQKKVRNRFLELWVKVVGPSEWRKPCRGPVEREGDMVQQGNYTRDPVDYER